MSEVEIEVTTTPAVAEQNTTKVVTSSEDAIACALQELADLAICASNDFHCLHFNVHGPEFDTLHAKVLKKYYEEAADDHDELAEKKRMYGATVQNANEAASRISYQSVVGDTQDDKFSRNGVIHRAGNVIDEILTQYTAVYKILNKKDDCPKAIGIANFLQTRIEYWSKERYFFNVARSL